LAVSKVLLLVTVELSSAVKKPHIKLSTFVGVRRRW